MKKEIPDPFWITPERALQYYEFTKTSFSQIYPLIADQILQRTGITTGACLDVGSGPAPLAIALVMKSDLRISTLDSSPRMKSLVLQNIHSLLLGEKIFPLLGDVHAIPVHDMTFDLVVSRVSYHAWHDIPLALTEIRRILKPDGMAYIGGGYGSPEIRDEVLSSRKERGIVDNSAHSPRTRFRKFQCPEIESAIKRSQYRSYQIIDDESGFWMILHP